MIHEGEEEKVKHYLKFDFNRYSNRLRKVWITTVVFAVVMIIIPILVLGVVTLLIYSINIQIKLNEISHGLFENLDPRQELEQ